MTAIVLCNAEFCVLEMAAQNHIIYDIKLFVGNNSKTDPCIRWWSNGKTIVRKDATFKVSDRKGKTFNYGWKTQSS